MNKNYHTAGPWSVAHDIPGSILDPGGDTVARVVQYTISPEKEIQANAHLIAAAPELLKALEALVKHGSWEWHMRRGECTPEAGVAVKAAIAAIAKAKGLQ